MDSNGRSLISRLKHAVAPEVRFGDLCSASNAGSEVFRELNELRSHLACDGMRLVQVLIPGRPLDLEFPPLEDLNSDAIEEEFHVEHEHLMSHTDGEGVSGDLELMRVLADLMRELATEEKRVQEEHHVLNNLICEVGLWSLLVPHNIVKLPSGAGGIAVVKNWRSTRGLGDRGELRGLVFRAERALREVEGRLDALMQRESSISKGHDEAKMPCRRRLYRNDDC